MRIVKLTSILMVAMLATAVLFTGCVKKPKLDLSGLQGNRGGAGDAGELGNGSDGPGFDGPSFDGPGFVDGPGFDGPGIVEPFEDDGNGDGAEKGGKWGGTDAPVQGVGGDGSGFLKNEQRWTDCVIYFAYDQYEVGAPERAKLDTLAKYLTENPTLGVIVEGHTDERGSDEYNRALGERRALAVVQYLGLMGVAANRCKTISYGEDKPAKSPATTEAEHQLNRRAEFLIGDL